MRAKEISLDFVFSGLDFPFVYWRQKSPTNFWQNSYTLPYTSEGKEIKDIFPEPGYVAINL